MNIDDWKSCLLGDVLTFQRGHDLPKVKMILGEYPVVGSNGIIGYHNEYTTEAPSITIGRSGNTGNPFVVYGRSWSHNTTLYVKEFKNSDPVFVYYLLKTLDLRNFSGGSAVPTLNRNHIHTINVTVPPLSEQFEIGYTLRMLDEKIANNNAINHHLEQMAQVIFTELCNEGEDALLSDILTVCYGKDHKRLGSGEIPCYGSGGIMRYVDESLYNGESVLIPRKGSLNNVLYVNEPFWTVDTMFYTHMTRPNVGKYSYFTVRDLDLAGMNVGSAVPSMTTAVLNALEIVLPSNDNLARFEEIVNPMFTQIQANNVESAHLATMRDALLPKLMSGELSVADLGGGK